MIYGWSCYKEINFYYWFRGYKIDNFGWSILFIIDILVFLVFKIYNIWFDNIFFFKNFYNFFVLWYIINVGSYYFIKRNVFSVECLVKEYEIRYLKIILICKVFI